MPARAWLRPLLNRPFALARTAAVSASVLVVPAGSGAAQPSALPRAEAKAAPGAGASRGKGAAPAGRAVAVKDSPELERALAEAGPGTTIRLAPGTYRGGISAAGLRGEPGRPIVIEAADPMRPPVIRGGGSGLQLSDPVHVELRHLVFSGASGNGLNIDDGGSYDTPAHHVVLRDVTVRDVGPEGNRDGIKLSGVDDFLVERCVLERWGAEGSGVDMVGCHRGRIVSCIFRDGGDAGGSGVQAKGGTLSVAIRGCRFEQAGARAVNVGGSTGLQYFRPRPQGYEAKDITVEDCTFLGGRAPIAFVNADGAVVRHNTIYRPGHNAVRILQEMTGEGFVPCRNGKFTDNLIAFRSDELGEAVNVGPNTAPETFEMARNAWYCLDRPDRSRPRLPIPESGGVYGQAPPFRDADRGDLRLRPGSRLARVGPRVENTRAGAKAGR